MGTYHYYAFVSYNHKDASYAQWLHRKLEGFRLPSEIHNELDAKSNHLRPIFRDKDELNAGVLADELRTKLEQSKYLIVICSPNSARSDWVSNEVKAFIEMGRWNSIIPFIIDGSPATGDCYPAALKEYVAEHPSEELIGVNVNEVGKEKAFIRVISRMIDVSFDSLWKRNLRKKRRNIAATSVAVLAVAAAILSVWKANQPKDVTVNVLAGDAANPNIPEISNVVVRMDLGDEVKVDTVGTIGGNVVFSNVPASRIGQEVRLELEADHCIRTDTTVVLSTLMDLALRRDPSVYGHVDRILYSSRKEAPLAGKTLSVAGIPVTTDSAGRFVLDIPLDRQSTEYEVTSEEVKLLDTKVFVPSTDGSILIAE